MSRFIEKLKQASKAKLPPLGFGRAQKAVKPKMMLIAVLDQDDAARAARLAGEADAILLKAVDETSLAEASKIITENIKDIPFGILSGKNGGLKEAAATGFDFIAFPLDSPLEIIEDEDIGRLLVIEAAMDKELLRAIGDMPLDAVLIGGEEAKQSHFTWRHFMLFRGIAAMCGKPLLLWITTETGEDELQLLWEAGVAGVAVETKTAAEIKKLSGIIDNLKPPSKKRKDKNRAIVPLMREEAAPVIDKDIEEEED